MDKKNIYIDFEVISSPFNKDLNINYDYPFMYSIGAYDNNEFKIESFMVDFKQCNENDKIDPVFTLLRKNIRLSIKKIFNDQKFDVSKETINFVAWDNHLEQKILLKIFRGFSVENQTQGEFVSLFALTKKLVGEKEYFVNFRKDLIKHTNEKFYTKRKLFSYGATAAIGGYMLYAHKNKKGTKFYFETNQETLKQELLEYSKDDVYRMHLVNIQGHEWLEEKKLLHRENNERKLAISMALQRNKVIHDCLLGEKEEMTLKELKKKISEETSELTKEIEKLTLD